MTARDLPTLRRLGLFFRFSLCRSDFDRPEQEARHVIAKAEDRPLAVLMPLMAAMRLGSLGTRRARRLAARRRGFAPRMGRGRPGASLLARRLRRALAASPALAPVSLSATVAAPSPCFVVIVNGGLFEGAFADFRPIDLAIDQFLDLGDGFQIGAGHDGHRRAGLAGPARSADAM